MNAAEALRRALAHRGDVKPPVADSIRAAIDPREPDQPMEWYDKVIAIGEAQDALEQKWEAQRKAEAEEKAKTPEPTTAGILAAAITKAATGSNSAVVPLNGAALLKSAIAAMGAGTINNESGE